VYAGAHDLKKILTIVLAKIWWYNAGMNLVVGFSKVHFSALKAPNSFQTSLSMILMSFEREVSGIEILASLFN